MPTLALYFPLAIAPLFTFAGIFAWVTTAKRIDHVSAIVWLFLALACYAALTSIWAIAPRAALLEAMRLLAEIILGFGIWHALSSIDPLQFARLRRGLLIGFACGGGMLAADIVSHRQLSLWLHTGPINNAAFDRGAIVMIIMAVALFIYTRNLYIVVLVVAVPAGATLLTDSISARLAIFMTVAVFAAVYYLPRPSLRIYKYIVPSLVIAMPLLTQLLPSPGDLASLPGVKFSTLHRLAIDRFVDDRIAERPFFGWGMDSARRIPGGKVPIVVPGIASNGVAEQLPLHPHNAVLQIWLELGLVGAILVAAALYLIIEHIARLPDKRMKAGVAAFSAAILSVDTVSFGAWQSWWIGAIFLAAGIVANGFHFTRKSQEILHG